MTIKDAKIATLVQVRDLETGDKFRVVNGDSELFVALKIHDCITISVVEQKLPAKHYSISLFEYVELVSKANVKIYGVFTESFGEAPHIVSCHLKKANAYREIFKLRNEYWYHSRKRAIGDFNKTLNIDVGYFKPSWFVKPLTLKTGED